MRKLTYEEVKKYIETQGYKLLSNEYVKSILKLQMMCPNGHIFEMSFHNFKDNNHRCPYCHNERRNESTKFTYNEVKEYLESFGYKILSTEYINSISKLDIECPNDHIFQMNFNGFKNNKNRCPICSNKLRADKQRLSYESIKECIELFDYKLLSKEYKNNRTKLLIQCDKGHKYEATWTCFQQGKRCPICDDIESGEKRKYSYEYVEKYIENEGYKLLSEEYVCCKGKLLIKCQYNHEFKMCFSNFKQGQRCPICNISKGERKIMNWLKNNNINYIYNEPYFNDLLSPLGNPLRPDFILIDYKIWIEYDGEFHYKDFYEDGSFEKLQIYDKLKDEYSIKNDWELIRIPYWELDNIEDILNKKIKDKR